MKKNNFNNPELMKRLNNILNVSPTLANSLERFCIAYEQNPDMKNKFAGGLGTFITDLTKIYAGQKITPDFIKNMNKNVDETKYNDLLNKLDKIVSENPKLGKALNTFCSACENRPQLISKFAGSISKYIGGMMVRYLEQTMVHTMTSQYR